MSSACAAPPRPSRRPSPPRPRRVDGRGGAALADDIGAGGEVAEALVPLGDDHRDHADRVEEREEVDDADEVANGAGHEVDRLAATAHDPAPGGELADRATGVPR